MSSKEFNEGDKVFWQIPGEEDPSVGIVLNPNSDRYKGTAEIQLIRDPQDSRTWPLSKATVFARKESLSHYEAYCKICNDTGIRQTLVNGVDKMPCECTRPLVLTFKCGDIIEKRVFMKEEKRQKAQQQASLVPCWQCDNGLQHA